MTHWPEQPFQVEGLWWRVVPGRKSPDDMRLEVELCDKWVPVPMVWGFLMADFFYENEDRLYPRPAAGGRYYLGAIHESTKNGWYSVWQKLRDQRLAKRLF